jgi:hypothetical protein
MLYIVSKHKFPVLPINFFFKKKKKRLESHKLSRNERKNGGFSSITAKLEMV